MGQYQSNIYVTGVSEERNKSDDDDDDDGQPQRIPNRINTNTTHTHKAHHRQAAENQIWHENIEGKRRKRKLYT